MSTPNNNRSSVRREQVQGEDPLFEAMRAPSSSPMPNTTSETAYLNTPPPPLVSPAPPNSIAGSQSVTPVPPYPHRHTVVIDSVETQADNILKNCVLPIERQKGILLKAIDVPASLEGLEQLRRCCSWQDVFKLSLQLTSESQGQSLSDFDRHAILCIRFESLFRTKLFDDLQSELMKEIATLGSKDIINDFEQDRLIAYKLLLSEARLMSGQGMTALESLLGLSHSLATSSQAIFNNDGTIEEKRTIWKAYFWSITTQCQIINAQVRLRQWRRASIELKKLEAVIHEAAQSSLFEQEKVDLCYAKVVVGTRLIRLLLQMGDKNSARAQLESISQSLANFPSLTGDVYLQQILMSCQGLLSFAEDNYESAAEIFAHLLETEKSREQYNSQFFTWSEPEPDILTVGMAFKRALCEAKDEGLLSSAVNNLSLSLLHLKQNRSAIEKLEQLIGLDPPAYMTDAVVFNLCTLYDLSYSPEISQQKKKVLQRIALRFGLIDPVLHWRSFRAN